MKSENTHNQIGNQNNKNAYNIHRIYTNIGSGAAFAAPPRYVGVYGMCFVCILIALIIYLIILIYYLICLISD